MAFSEPSKHVISLQSSGRCANPSCRISLLENFKLIGRYCHIEGEKKNSPRYNPDQSEAERDSPQNGILLCSNCHTLIDGDPVKYTTLILHEWKESDQNSPKLQEWLDKRIPFLSIVSSVQDNLPIKPSSYLGERSLFLGRNLEIGELSDQITSGDKVVSVIGEGGIGKSSLSIKVVRKVENLFDIIIPVSLTPGTTYHDFLLEIGRFINSSFLNSLATNDLETLLKEVLGSVGKILLFVDNYENVADFIDASPNQNLKRIHFFLESLPPNASVFLNSRNRSNLVGETTLDLSGLTSEDAVNLFLQMVKNYLPNPLPTEIECKIAEICNMVEGHPLAIKLIGGTYKGGGVSRLNAMYDELFFSIQNMRESTDRHRSITACFNYSYLRLAVKLKKYLQKLTLFKSFFIRDSTIEIFGIQESQLTDLFQRTLLQRSAIQGKGGEEIFVYDFHPLIKSYLIGKCPEYFSFTEYELKRYVKYHSNFIRKLYDSFNEDIPKNSKLIELMTEWTSNDLWEAINGIENEETRSVISNLLGLLLLQTGHKARALPYHQLCYEIDFRKGDLDRIANDLTNIAACISEFLYSEKALSIRAKLASDFEFKNSYKKAGRQYISIGLYYFQKGDFENSESSFNKALSNFRKETGNDRNIADTLLNLTATLWRNEKYQEGIDCSKDSIGLYEKLECYLSAASASANLSICYLKRNGADDLDNALKAIEYAKTIDLGEKNTRGLIRDYRIMTEVYQMKDDEVQASICDTLAKDAITQFEKETHQPFNDTGFSDYLEFSDGST
jgi:tetratricopeptide (TPR) repeat protein